MAPVEPFCSAGVSFRNTLRREVDHSHAIVAWPFGRSLNVDLPIVVVSAHVRGNHFSPHMFIEALKLDMRVIEVPVTFRRRVGESKGVGSNKLKAARVALRMLGLIYRA